MKSFLFRKDPSFSQCPSCSSFNTLHRSRVRNWKESLIKSFSFLKIYRCNKCGWRGYKSTLIITSESVRNLLIYIGIALLAGLVVMQVLKKIIAA